ETTIQQVETPAEKGNANVLLTHLPAPSFKIKSVLKGILGMIVLLVIGFLFSKDRRNIPWKTVVVGLIIQIVLAIGVLYVPFIRITFEFSGRFL
ncbi:nucleoside transporter, partial [sediment metagenome]